VKIGVKKPHSLEKNIRKVGENYVVRFTFKAFTALNPFNQKCPPDDKL